VRGAGWAAVAHFKKNAKNLRELLFDKHIFLQEGKRGTSTVEVGGEEVKNENWSCL
jgi:hypothetical protein